MANKLQIKRSSVPAKVPTTTDLHAGELGLNTPDEKLYFGTGTSIRRVLTDLDGSTFQPLLGYTPENLAARGAANGYASLDSAGNLPATQLPTKLEAFNGLDGLGFLVQSAVGTYTNRSLVGTINQVTITNGNGIAGDCTIAIADNPVMPGVAGVSVPTGDISERSVSAPDGTMRYNDELLQLEAKIQGSWQRLLAGSVDNAAVSIRRTTNQNATTTETNVTFNTTDINNAPTDFTVGATSITVNRAGLYLLGIEGETIHTTTTALVYHQIQVNGVDIPNGIVTINSRSTRMTVSKTIPYYLNTGDVVSVTVQSSTGTGAVQAGFSLMVCGLRGTQGPAGVPGGTTTLMYPAATFDNPNNSNWVINALAPVTVDSTDNSLSVRAFDDTVEEGVGMTVYVPPTASTLTFNLTHRCATAPATSRTVQLSLYAKRVNINAAVGAWSARLTVGNIATSTNAFYQTLQVSLDLATLGIVPGNTYQFELTRNSPSATDNLVGDFLLLNTLLSFT